MAVLATVIVFGWFICFSMYAWHDLQELAASEERRELLDRLWGE